MLFFVGGTERLTGDEKNMTSTTETVTVAGRTFTVGVNAPGVSDWNRAQIAKALRGTSYEVQGDASFTRVQVWRDVFAMFDAA